MHLVSYFSPIVFNLSLCDQHLYFLFYLPCRTSCHRTTYPLHFRQKNRNHRRRDGKPFHMVGTNLGNWLVPEGYMFKFKHSSSPRLISGSTERTRRPRCRQCFLEEILRQLHHPRGHPLPEIHRNEPNPHSVSLQTLHQRRLPRRQRRKTRFCPDGPGRSMVQTREFVCPARYALRAGWTNGRQYRRRVGVIPICLKTLKVSNLPSTSGGSRGVQKRNHHSGLRPAQRTHRAFF